MDANIQWGLDKKNNMLAARKTKSPSKLRKMAKDLLSGVVSDDGHIAGELVKNLGLPFYIAYKLAKDFNEDEYIEYNLCTRPDATAKALDKLADSKNPDTVEAVARHSNLWKMTVRKLARQKISRIAAVMAVAKLSVHTKSCPKS